jgi:hypothetical protein|tara:strand:- start:6 stop:221 length:216 start_codon:yes stop_codon:yes gene_type:complete
MNDAIKKYLTVLLEGATKNLTQMDEYIASTEEQLKGIKESRVTISEDITELESLLGEGKSEDESSLKLVKD